jgi:hypothetical protein
MQKAPGRYTASGHADAPAGQRCHARGYRSQDARLQKTGDAASHQRIMPPMPSQGTRIQQRHLSILARVACATALPAVSLHSRCLLDNGRYPLGDGRSLVASPAFELGSGPCRLRMLGAGEEGWPWLRCVFAGWEPYLVCRLRSGRGSAVRGSAEALSTPGLLVGSGSARCVQVPLAGDALQRVLSAIVEFDS